MKIKADLHIHSTLSPCASLEMSPAAIVKRARDLGLDLIAVTDHNSTENGFIAASLGEAAGLRVLFGMEAQTREDVHMLCLFARRSEAERFNERVYSLLPDVRNNPDFFGDQLVVDEQDNIVRHEEKLLLNALDISIPDLLELVKSHGGVSIPAHVEAPPFGLLVNLGMVPDELAGAVLEVSCAVKAERARQAFPVLANHPLISNSDSHFLEDIGRAFTTFAALSPSLPDLLEAARTGAFQVVYRGCHG
jgi:predicted metal-dependent phosphoesterase TrpH